MVPLDRKKTNHSKGNMATVCCSCQHQWYEAFHNRCFPHQVISSLHLYVLYSLLISHTFLKVVRNFFMREKLTYLPVSSMCKMQHCTCTIRSSWLLAGGLIQCDDTKNYKPWSKVVTHYH